jgi:hypothetical protein
MYKHDIYAFFSLVPYYFVFVVCGGELFWRASLRATPSFGILLYLSFIRESYLQKWSSSKSLICLVVVVCYYLILFLL